ncbi:MAG: hypothetical protein HY727_12090 [Candidatus Rokubacteria bacterium]|nr:hypothetical protein [Candidatus Rokubacteria bacterium]
MKHVSIDPARRRPLLDQRGVALPMAMIALLLLTSLLVAFAALSATEPLIANNHLRSAQARALAEAGLERAIWALSIGKNAPGTSGSIALPAPGVTAAAPYDGSTLITVVSAAGTTIGGYTLRIVGVDKESASVTSTGFTPNNDPNDTRTKAMKQITATVYTFPDLAINAPCALCVNGDLMVSGNSDIDSRSDGSCGSKNGTYTSGVTTVDSSSAAVHGLDGNNVKNEIGVPGGATSDIVVGAPTSDFNNFKFSDRDLNQLKEVAKKNGTYYQGSVTFNAGNYIPNGIVFIDTLSGNNIPTDPTQQNTSDFASVTIHGNHSADMTAGWTGMIVSNGTINISGNVKLNGLIYAVNDLSYTGTGTGYVEGLVISQNIRDTVASSIDANSGGNASIAFNCAKAKGGGATPSGYMLLAGTYKEVGQ